MNCSHVQAHLDDYIDDILTLNEQYQVAAHLQQCSDCRFDYEQRQTLQRQLKDISVPPLRPEFVARVSASLRPEVNNQRRVFMAGFGSAVAAGLIIALLVANPFFKPRQDIGLVTVQVSPNALQKVNLVFNSPRAVTQATMSIELPANVELAGYPGKHRLTWTTTLQRGSNRLQLPLILRNRQAARVVTRISRDGKDKTFYLNLTAKTTPSVAL